MSSTSIKQKLAIALKGEPEKTFIKAGIANIDGSLTPDGQSIFLDYLLKKHGEEFKKEVVDKILAEDSKD